VPSNGRLTAVWRRVFGRFHLPVTVDLDLARRVAETHYGLGPLDRLEEIPGGRVNRTFLLEAPGGRFILQRLHPTFGLDGAVVRNMAAVTERLAGSPVKIPQVLPTASGGWYVQRQGIWRLTTFLSGRPAPSRASEAAAEAARVLGLFHRLLAQDPPRLEPLPPAEHNRERPAGADAWAALIENRGGEEKFGAVESALRQGLDLVAALPEFTASTRTVVHGDPKLENFLFDERGAVVGLIDLDTVRQGALLWELADAFRSWAGRMDARPGPAFDAQVFQAAWRAYRRHGLALAPAEREKLPAAVRAVVLDLGRRYLADYFDETYFAWDQSRYASLAAQNLERGSRLLALARDLVRQETELGRS